MNEFREKGVGRLGSKGLLVSMIVVTILVVSSTVAVVAMSRSSADTTLTITSVSHNPEEGYVNQLVEWTVVVETQDEGQQGRGLLFTWSWGDGSYTVDYLKSIGSNTTAINTQTHAWSEAGRYKVAISVWDGFGTEQSALHNVTARIWFVVTSAPALTPHDPISIDGDSHFAAIADAESWPGDGTEADPYVIEFLDISGDDLFSAIRVENTEVHFIVRNCLISTGYQYSAALYLRNVGNASVHSNSISSPFSSIYCEQCWYLSIEWNTVNGGSQCIGLIGCQQAFVGNNTVQDAERYPLCISSSYMVTLRGNRFDGSGISIMGTSVSHWTSHDIDDSNLVNDGPVYYFKNRYNGTVPSEAGQIILANCYGMLVSCNASGGITLGFSPSNTIAYSMVSSAHYGIYLAYSSRTTIISTSVVDCSSGIRVLNSPYCVIQDSFIYRCDCGIDVQQSSRLSVLNNSILESNEYGVLIFYSGSGDVKYNLIAGGLQEGLCLVDADYWIVASNNFVSNTIQATEDEYSAGNIWDDGYPSAGNYWSDYTGDDLFSGPNQDILGSDGIGDTPYVLASGSQDNYPLMEPFVPGPEPPNEPPVASFAVVSINGATVSVDASTSYDPDGTIVSYHWDWGDGSGGTGETATHTYELPETTTLSSTGTTSDTPPPPYYVLGYTKDVYGGPMPNSTVTVTNVRTAEFLVVSSDMDGFYMCDIASMPEPFEEGDMILVEAVNDGYNGSAIGYVGPSFPYPWIQVDVILEWDPSQGSFEVEITLTVVDDGNLTGIAVRIVRINFTSTTPPVAAFTVSVDGLTVSVNASESWDNEDPVEELEVRWDWENDGVWDTEWTTDKMATHVYAVAGTYDVILEVMDREGLTDTANRSVTVFESPGPAEHEPIRIDGDEEFTYENGVVQGTGSVLNPFVIEEWTIEADTASGISIANTEAHFVIRDVNVFNGLNNGFKSGISLCNVTNGTVDSCMASYCGWGIAVFSCFNINISNNDITSCYYGVGVVDTSAVYVWLNHVGNSLGIGISVNITTTDFILFRNTIVDSGFYGVDMAGCQLGWVDSNTIAGSGTCGVRLTGHNEQITVVHNAFLNNTVQAEDDNFVENAWNSGYPLGGNYWSDYDGVDLFSGPDQDLPGSDGIGDTPYTIGVFDQYPLMTPP